MKEVATQFEAIVTTTNEASNNQDADDADSDSNSADSETDSTDIALKCKFDTSVYDDLTKAETYNIFGEETYDTVACGYLVTETKDAFDTGEESEVAYFRTLDVSFGFKGAIEDAIQEGNSVNRKVGKFVDFRLGCIEDDEFVTGESGTTSKSDRATDRALLSSTQDKPINLVLSFEENTSGTKIVCDSLASNLEVVE